MSSEVKSKEPWALFKTFVALLLILLCAWAAQWQYHRGVDRHARNAVIEHRISKSAIDLTQIESPFADYEWQTISTSGTFDNSKQILLRNRYNEGKYGYEVLTFVVSVSQ